VEVSCTCTLAGTRSYSQDNDLMVLGTFLRAGGGGDSHSHSQLWWRPKQLSGRDIATGGGPSCERALTQCWCCFPEGKCHCGCGGDLQVTCAPPPPPKKNNGNSCVMWCGQCRSPIKHLLVPRKIGLLTLLLVSRCSSSLSTESLAAAMLRCAAVSAVALEWIGAVT
jgi:hypothetical protein